MSPMTAPRQPNARTGRAQDASVSPLSDDPSHRPKDEGTRHAPVTVFHGGTVLTMDPARPDADLVVVEGDRIAAVGTRADAARWPDAAVVELGAATLVPGLIDAHHHLSVSALHPRWRDCSDVRDPSQLAVAVRRQADAEPEAAVGPAARMERRAVAIHADASRPGRGRRRSPRRPRARHAPPVPRELRRARRPGHRTGYRRPRRWGDRARRGRRAQRAARRAGVERGARALDGCLRRARPLGRAHRRTRSHAVVVGHHRGARRGVLAGCGTGLSTARRARRAPDRRRGHAPPRRAAHERADRATRGPTDRRCFRAVPCWRVQALRRRRRRDRAGHVRRRAPAALRDPDGRPGVLRGRCRGPRIPSRRPRDRQRRGGPHARRARDGRAADSATATTASASSTRESRGRSSGGASPSLEAIAVVQPGFVEHVGIQSGGVRFDDHHWLAFAGLAEAGVRLAGSSDEPCAPTPPLWCAGRGVTRTTSTGIRLRTRAVGGSARPGWRPTRGVRRSPVARSTSAVCSHRGCAVDLAVLDLTADEPVVRSTWVGGREVYASP